MDPFLSICHISFVGFCLILYFDCPQHRRSLRVLFLPEGLNDELTRQVKDLCNVLCEKTYFTNFRAFRLLMKMAIVLASTSSKIKKSILLYLRLIIWHLFEVLWFEKNFITCECKTISLYFLYWFWSKNSSKVLQE